MNEFKKRLKEKIKMYSKKEYLDGYIKNEFMTDDGDADIFLNITEKNQLFDSRTMGDQIDLSNNIYDFIESKTSMLDNDIIISLHIIGIELTSKEQGMIKHIIKEHYAIELYKIQKLYNRYKNKILLLIMFGLLAFVSYFLFYLNTNFNFLFEVLTFMFSFSLWEAFDSIIYTFSDIKNEREAICQNLLIDIVFE